MKNIIQSYKKQMVFLEKWTSSELYTAVYPSLVPQVEFDYVWNLIQKWHILNITV